MFSDKMQPQRKKLHGANKGSYYLGGNFSNIGNVSAPFQYRREKQSQHVER